MPPNASFFDRTWFLTGPTASGKSAAALDLACRIDAEIVSLDSMAVYRGMDIGTAKPPAAERQTVPHQLIDVVEPADDFSVAQYLAAARIAVDEIRGRGRQVLFVGGTPMYLKALLRGLFEGPTADPDLRQEFMQLAEREGSARLHEMLAEIDPTAAGKLHPNDTRRLIRALEVHRRSGLPISEQQREFAVGRSAEAGRVFVLNWPRAKLHERINARVDAMFAAGLVDEVQQLMAADRPIGRTASQAVGYREVIAYLQTGGNLAETIELVKTRTRQFAKRQMTWFRSLSECRWIAVDDPFDPAAIAERVAAIGRSVKSPAAD
jgi:tRNA dimethylallyltransferase